MPAASVVGVQWGDEGKGKIMDILTGWADVIIRFQGGANAGHTVVTQGEKFVFHLLPSGILHADKLNILGNGVVVDPKGILQEMDEFTSRGIRIGDNFRISGKAHMVMPYHKALEAAQERGRSDRIGTTMRGIGPCYMDKMARMGLRMIDLKNFDRFVRKVKSVLPSKNRILTEALDAEPVSEKTVIEEYAAYAERLAPFVANAGDLVRGALRDGRRVIFEGAQGTMLDIDHGTYPFVTSSNSCAVGIAAGCGVSPLAVGSIRGVVKAYTTRVGEGPFPTELMDEVGEGLQSRGGEVGATTGRPRRCGWLDGLGLRYAVELNGVQQLAVTKLDVLGGVDPIRVCVAYDTPEGRLEVFPEDIELLSEVTPVYREFKGWSEDISGARTFEDLPEACRTYLAAVEEIGGAEIDIVSLGPDREQTIFKPGCTWKP